MLNHGQKFVHKYEDIISLENLLYAWKEFLCGKRNKKDVQEFQYRLFDEIYRLHYELIEKIYKHGNYKSFNISDPKPRKIHKANVRDRLLHHAVYRQLYPYFDKKFISDSYSCRINKGTLRAVNRFRAFGNKVGKNNTRTVWVLKCDIRKFFASIDQNILIKILKSYIEDKDIVWLLKNIIYSFNLGDNGKGIPLGNLTSQLFANVYMNELDQFVKHKLKIKYYIRYTDDFVVINNNKNKLESVIPKLKHFLELRLKISLNPDKVFIKTLDSGVDFLGWIHFPRHRIIRITTKRKILRRVIKNKADIQTTQSYLGLLRHGNTFKLKNRILSSLKNNL